VIYTIFRVEKEKERGIMKAQRRKPLQKRDDFLERLKTGS